ncbi:LysM protein [Methanosarcina siciliae C2J]|uniref:LysM protein n=1 Tax=Methanosarcina siciliae C2J TaxID=1434118 RepID=A0A0E3PJD2_9EURY|nr:LysM protein [Methanosarcina siciliae C2J]
MNMETENERGIKDPKILASEVPGTTEIEDLTASEDLIAQKGLDVPVKKSASSPKASSSKAASSKEHFLAWDKEYSHLKWGGPASIRNLQVYIAPEARILDAGSGNGRYLGELSRHYSAVGIDISRTALGSSRAQLARSGRFAEHLGASVHALPFKSGSFAGILCYGVLQHLFEEEREAAVREFMRVLNCGGLTFFEAFGREDMRCGGEPSSPFEENTFVRQNGIIYHYFSEEEVKTLFCGFEVLELENVRKEKIFRGESYVRHMVRGIFRKI